MNDKTEDLEVWLSEPQTAVLSSRAAITLDMAGQGSGKSQNIGYSSGMFVSEFPQLLGFIAANTLKQLSQSTLARVFETWERVYGFTEYDAKYNKGGSFVIDKKPPPHFTVYHKFKEYDGTISFWNGALIFTGSLENYKAHDGKTFAYAHLDETKDTKEDALKLVILGRLRQYGLWFENNTKDLFYNAGISAQQAEELNYTAWNPLFIHTSPTMQGAAWLNTMFKLDKFDKEIRNAVMQEDRDFFHRQFDNKCVVIYAVHHNKPNLPPNYIRNQMDSLADDDQIMKLVYGYPFGKSGGEWIHAFRRDKHVKQVLYKKGEASHISLDFNSIPYMTCLCAQVDFITRYIDQAGTKHDTPQIGAKLLEVMVIRIYREYCLEEPQNSTEAIGEAFKSEHDPAFTEVFYYGDANGLSRIPGLGSQTNFKILEESLYMYLHNDSKQVKAPNIGVFSRRDLVNKILSGKIPGVEIEIDSECGVLIEDLENVKSGPKGKVKQEEKDPRTGKKFEKYGHTTDALEYLVCELCKHYLTT